MIPAAEIQRAAGALGVEPSRIDLDYTLGWLLRGLVAQPAVTGEWLFKGGTCLRKCYFPGYRFSEDLDFTLLRAQTAEETEACVLAAARSAQEGSGIDFQSQPLRIEVMRGEESGYRVRLYYRGSSPMGGNPRSIQVHVSAAETVETPAQTRGINHPYSDAAELGAVTLRCYSLVEILAEKLRAICGQRRYALARDLFDLHELMRRGASLQEATRILPTKCSIKNVTLGKEMLQDFEARVADFRLDWDRNLLPLLPQRDKVPFDEAWATARNAVGMARGGY